MEKNMSYNQAEAIENIRLSESPSASFSLSGNITVSREYDRLVFSAAKKEDPSPEDKMQSLAGRQQEGQERWHMEQMTFGQFETYRREADGRGAVYGAFQGVDPQELQIRTCLLYTSFFEGADIDDHIYLGSPVLAGLFGLKSFRCRGACAERKADYSGDLHI